VPIRERIFSANVVVSGSGTAAGATIPTPNITSLERAFQLARSGHCKTTADIQLRLKAGGYSTNQVIGPTLMKQLRAVIDNKSCPPAECRRL
jgi:hypothetical protein